MFKNNILRSKVDGISLIGISLILFNLIYAIRLIGLIINLREDIKSVLILVLFLTIAILLIIVGFNRHYLLLVDKVINYKGMVFGIFLIFIVIKKVVNWILVSPKNILFLEIGPWYLAIFLLLVVFLSANFIKKLASILPEKDKNNFQEKTPERLFFRVFFSAVLIIIVGVWFYTQLINPLPLYAGYDPEYAYMINSMTPFKDLELYRRMDHPGTIMQLLGSGFYILLSPFGMIRGTYPFQFIISTPESFLYLSRFFILLINCFTLYLLGKHFWNSKNWSESFAGASVLISYFAIHQNSHDFLLLWSPNSFNFAIITTFLFLLFHLFTRDEKLSKDLLWVYSIGAGIAATFHVYKITLMIGISFSVFFYYLFKKENLANSIINSIKSLFFFITGYVIGTLVILPHYGSYLTWIKSILTHQGIYGQGEQGFLSMTRLFSNFSKLFTNNKFLLLVCLGFFILFISLLYLKKDNFKNLSPLWSLSIGLVIQVSVLIVIISRHPVDRYLLSVAAVTPILILVIYSLTEKDLLLSRVIFSSIAIIFMVAFLINIKNHLQSHNQRVDYLQSYQNEVNRVLDDFSQMKQIERNEINQYWTYGSFSSCYALWFGNDFGKRLFTNEITDLCLNEHQIDIWNKSIPHAKNSGIRSVLEQNQNNIIIGNIGLLGSYDMDSFGKINESAFPGLGYIIPE